MARLAALVDRHHLDAAVAWTATLSLTAAAAQFVRAGEPQWTVFVALLVGVALVPPILDRDPAVTLPGELLVLITAPVLVRATGAYPQATPFLVAAGLALLTAVVLEAYTSLEMTVRFAVLFTVTTTMAVAGAWTVGIWAADAVLGTTYLQGMTELMWDLVSATAMGVVAGVIFEVYFYHTGRLVRLRDPSVTEQDADEGGPAAAVQAGDRHVLAVRAMQLVLVAITGLAAVQLNWTLLVNSGVPLAITLLPGVLRREYGFPMHAGLVFWVTVAATLHAIGATGPYETVSWYDSVTHTVSATLVAGVGYAVARAAELHTDQVSFDPRFRAAFVLLFVLAVGVGWETLEFASGLAARAVGTEAVLAQYGAGDIARDLLFDAVGGLVVATWSTDQFESVAYAVADRVGVLVER